MTFTVVPIGKVHIAENYYLIQLEKEYKMGLLHLDGFSHLYVIWWAHLTDNYEERSRTITKNIFRKAPNEVGVFASRTPVRPNPVMISTVKVLEIDHQNGIIHIPFIDAEHDTPVIDIKPYFPVERQKTCSTPRYYSHWPKWAEDAEKFNWKEEISLDGG